MKFLNKNLMMLGIASLMFTNCDAQVKNAKTETVIINGNCGMCKKTIEKAGNQSKIANVEWNKDTKIATLTFDSTQTNLDEILLRIANAGYDSETFTAPDDVYNNLHHCCQYQRNTNINN